ncbi:MAG: type II secretion system GspH family protein [Candidatus Riflebacteria bacterium]|nr:type II secretion system GspH family protein [Candidatus Riflebacteria bacterium]
MKKAQTTNRGFTLLELSVSVLIVSLIILVLIVVFRSNLATFKWGQQHMEFNQKIQLVMKQLFTDFKQINPILRQDEEGHMFLQGEKIGDLFPNLVTIFDKDKDPDNGGEEVAFFLTTFSDMNRRDHIKYFIDKSELIRQKTDHDGNVKRFVVAEKVSDLHFTEDSGDIRQIKIKLTMTDPKKPERSENLDFAVRLETDLVCVKTVREYD